MTASISALNDATVRSYLRELRRYPPMSREEEREAAREARKGDRKAYDRLVACNLRFVVSVALEYQGRGLPLSELIAEGNVGLLGAVERFDEERGYKLISYAVWRIRQSIQRALCRAHLVSVPSNRVDDKDMINRHWNRICQRSGQTPTLEEVSEDMKISPLRAERALRSVLPALRLDAPADPLDEGTRTLSRTLEARAPEPDSDILEGDRRELIAKALAACLSGREEKVIRACYGLDQGTGQTLEQIGGELGVTRERVRQIRDKALAKIRLHFAQHLPAVTGEDIF